MTFKSNRTDLYRINRRAHIFTSRQNVLSDEISPINSISYSIDFVYFVYHQLLQFWIGNLIDTKSFYVVSIRRYSTISNK